MNQQLMVRKSQLILFGLLFGLSFALHAQVESSMGGVFDIHQYEKESIQFLMLQANKSGKKEHIKLVKSAVRSGRLKKEVDIDLHHHSAAPDWYCSIVDEKDKVLLKFSMSNPFSESLEYVDEETNELKRKEVILDEKFFNIRLPYEENYNKLRIEKSKGKKGKLVLISEIELK